MATLFCPVVHYTTHFLYLCSKSQEIYKRIKKTFSSSEVLYRHALLPRLISTTRLNSHPQVVRTNNLMWAEVYSAHTQRVPKNEIDHLYERRVDNKCVQREMFFVRPLCLGVKFYVNHNNTPFYTMNKEHHTTTNFLRYQTKL